MNEIIHKKPIVFRSNVEKKSKYSDYRDDLRVDFWYSCAYCSMTEDEACGIGFEIDHYLPQNFHPALSNDYNNLMWSCQKCNSLKRDYNPNDSDTEKGLMIIRPDNENPSYHFKLNYNKLEGKTITGEFNIVYLALNRMQLQKLRMIRKKFYESSEYIKQGIKSIASIKIDRIDKKNRFLFEKMKKHIIERQKILEDPESVSSILKVFGKSELIDSDPEKRKQLKSRKNYLKQQRAITVPKL